MANRVAFLADGFNLYHSIRDVHRRTGLNYRWLDIRAMCSSFLPQIGNVATLHLVYYFSALAYHVEDHNPGAVKRHRTYISALESTGVMVQLNEFKRKEISCKCPCCGKQFTLVRHEEKETDVAIAATLLELQRDDEVGSVVIVSGDTDLVAAVKVAMRLGQKPIYMLYPVGRRNRAFLGEVNKGFRLKEAHYERYQFPEQIRVSNHIIRRPAQWS